MTSPISFEPISHTYTDSNGAIFRSATQFLELFHSKFEDVEEFWLFYKSIQYASDIDKETKIKKFDQKLALRTEEYLIKHYGQPFLFDSDMCAKWTKLGVWKFKDDADGFKEVFKPHERLLLEVISTFVKEHWVAENVKSTVRGTAFHNEKEDDQFSQGLFEYNQVKYKIDNNCDNLSSLKENCVYPELRLHNTKYKIAGTSDQVLVMPGKKIIIRDWKTNKEIKTSNKYDKLFYPVAHLDNCEYVKYSLQLSLYGYMLEQFGYEVVDIEFEHFVLDSDNKAVSSTIYKCPYLKEDIVNMLNHYQATMI
jgi:hypothetical protein